MIGQVDDKGRALLDVSISNKMHGAFTPVTAWIDTAFDGHLVFSRELIESLDLEPLVETEAIFGGRHQSRPGHLHLLHRLV